MEPPAPWTKARIKLGVVGSRTFADRAVLDWYLDRYAVEFELESIVSGGANGADKMAADWAKLNGVTLVEHLPDYTRFGRVAPLERNLLIARDCDRLLAFYPSATPTPGTTHCVHAARKRGIPVEEVFVDENLRDVFYGKEATDGAQEAGAADRPEG